MATSLLIEASHVCPNLDLESLEVSSVTEHYEKCSSELNSYEDIPLEELTPDQVRAIADGADFATLHARSKQIGVQVMKFIRFFEKYKPIVAAMRAKFNPRRGSHCRTEVEPGLKMTWAEYCETFYGVSYRWTTKLTSGDYVVVPNEDAVEASNSNGGEPNDTDPPATTERKIGKKDKLIVQLQGHVKTLTSRLNVLQATPEAEQLSPTVLDLQMQLSEERRKNEELAVSVSELDEYGHQLEDCMKAANLTTPQEWSPDYIVTESTSAPAVSSEVIAYFAELKSDAKAFAGELTFLVRQHGLSGKIKVQLL